MPIIIPKDLPAYEILEKESVFLMNENRASIQDIRPLKIGLVNLMPKKIQTETQLLRMLANSPLQVDVDLITLESHESKNTKKEHLLKFYNSFSSVRNNKYDGMIITGAPVENIAFEEVDYWQELYLSFARLMSIPQCLYAGLFKQGCTIFTTYPNYHWKKSSLEYLSMI